MIRHIKEIFRIIKTNTDSQIFLILLFLLIGFFIYRQFKVKKVFKNPDFTIAEITNVRSGAKLSKHIEFKYFVNNKQFYNEQEFAFHPIIGEKFQVAYQKDNPNNSFLLIEKPYFNYPDSLTSLVTGLITCKRKEWMWVRVKFDYNKKRYEYEKAIPEDIFLKEDDSIKMLILTSNPEISKILK
jgi:hypothetical protein